MLVRSPRRFLILSFLALVFIFAALQRSPRAQQNVYDRLPLFAQNSRPPDQEPISNAGDEGSQAQFEEAWQHAVPVAGPSPAKPAAMLVAGTGVRLPPPAASVPPAKATVAEVHPPWVTAPSRTAAFIPPTPRPSSLKAYMRKMLKWDRPTWDGHWPPFADYVDKMYDPNRWERFKM